MERSHGHRGQKQLTSLLAAVQAPPERTRSQVEEAFIDLIRAEGLPMPAMNVKLGEYEVDAVWPDRKLVVEIDHYSTHGHPAAFERDRIRDAEIQIAGFRAVRITDGQIDEHRAAATRLRRLLEV
jgi:very-short-patch-repair endonuclease